MSNSRLRLGTLLVEAGLLSEAQLEAALAEQRRTGQPLGRVLVDSGLASAAAVANALATQHGGTFESEYGIAVRLASVPRMETSRGEAGPTLEAEPEPALEVEPAEAPVGAERAEEDAAAAEPPEDTEPEPQSGPPALEERLLALEDAYGSMQAELARARREIGELRRHAVALAAAPAAPAVPVAAAAPPRLHAVEAAAPEPPAPRPPAAGAPAPAERTEEEPAGTEVPSRRLQGPRIGDLLLLKGYIDREQLAAALYESKNTGVMLGRVLLAKGWIFEEELARCLSEQWGLEYVSLMRTGVDLAAARLLPRQVGLDAAAVPVRRGADGLVTVAFADPTDDGSLTAVETYVGEFAPVVAELSDITTALRSVPA